MYRQRSPRRSLPRRRRRRRPRRPAPARRLQRRRRPTTTTRPRGATSWARKTAPGGGRTRGCSTARPLPSCSAWARAPWPAARGSRGGGGATPKSRTPGRASANASSRRRRRSRTGPWRSGGSNESLWYDTCLPSVRSLIRRRDQPSGGRRCYGSGCEALSKPSQLLQSCDARAVLHSVASELHFEVIWRVASRRATILERFVRSVSAAALLAACTHSCCTRQSAHHGCICSQLRITARGSRHARPC